MAAVAVYKGCTSGPANGITRSSLAVAVAVANITCSLVLASQRTRIVDKAVGMSGSGNECGVAADDLGMAFRTSEVGAYIQVVDMSRVPPGFDVIGCRCCITAMATCTAKASAPGCHRGT